ncbi:hypothetical protein H0H92_009935 [Tricholoma furcatifolium]|nr:hypothetical protein H0H92_009935 [Tricholoma furcatifolium]
MHSEHSETWGLVLMSSKNMPLLKEGSSDDMHFGVLEEWKIWASSNVSKYGTSLSNFRPTGFPALLKEGTRTDRDDAMPLVYAPCPYIDDEDEDEDEDEDVEMTMEDDGFRISPPPTKRPRTALWEPPEHIPDFLPPFPPLTPPDVPLAPETAAVMDSETAADPTLQSQMDTQANPATPKPTFETRPPPRVAPNEPNKSSAPTAALTATSASDYLVQVPYAQSSLAQVAEWHLPTAPRSSYSTPAKRPRQIETDPALVKAYHHILTHPPPPASQGQGQTLAKYKASMALLKLMQNSPRWEPADTLFGSVVPGAPRVGSIGPTYPMAVGGENKGGEAKEKFPPTLPKAVGAGERIANVVSQQGSRIQDLARSVLPPPIVSRTSRLTHPPPLQRGAKLLVYGGGLPAPWNANPLPGTAGEKEEKEETNKAILGDARLYATWEVESKDFRSGIMPRRAGRGR